MKFKIMLIGDVMNRIKLLREERNIYQKDLAKLLGVSIPAINYYENEKRAMDTETASTLAKYFDVSIDYLLGKSDIRNNREIKIDDIDIAFASGIKGLNDENKAVAKSIIDSLLAKQKMEEDKKEKK